MIRLQLIEKEDLKNIVAWNKDTSPEFLMQWAGPYMQYPLTINQMEQYMENSNVNGENTDTYFYKMVDTETGKMVGSIELGKIDRINNSARIGKVLIGTEETRGKGFGRQAITQIVRVGFEDLKLHRITLGVFDFNESALRCYKSAGFRIEGNMKKSRRIGNEYWNLLEMAILEKEWRALQMSGKSERTIRIGSRYRHYKGKEYLVINVARHSETLEEMVVYQKQYDDFGIWVRPADMFLDRVLVDGNLISRFQEIEA